MEDKTGDSGEQKEEITHFIVELFFDKETELKSVLLLDSLRKYCGSAEIEGDPENENPRFLVSSPENINASIRVGLSTAGFTRENVLDYASSFRQSWSWRTAKDVVQACSHIIRISDGYDCKVNYKDRVLAMRNVIRALAECSACKAIHFQMTQQFIKPEGYLASFNEPAPDRLFGFVNVRFFKIHDSDDMLMDTIGLNPMGLEDMQCSFKKYNPKDISNVLYNTAYYLFDNGNVIIDDDTVQGVKRTDKWACRRTRSLVVPKRTVIDIAPGFFK
ncbi:MAG: DUF4261 domain-containing protein [Lentisphaerae bacterium]|nr:DUF4261 domain-containing protein [Lentisphaerota bacterium]